MLRQIDQAYDRKSWHGTNLRGSLRTVTAAQASWRPARNRHNIWEIVVHAAYWKHRVAARVAGGSRLSAGALAKAGGSFPLEGSNWFTRPVEATEHAWRADLRLLKTTHAQLRAAVARLPARTLARTPPGGKVTYFDLVAGIIAHDLYHAGQIQLLKRLSASGSGLSRA